MWAYGLMDFRPGYWFHRYARERLFSVPKTEKEKKKKEEKKRKEKKEERKGKRGEKGL